MKTHLYNTAHPLAESGKPIFIPFGEWKYDGQSRQRLDRAHGEKIANELNARVAKGDPGIPVYQGHPDVPALAAKYPDKGALGWVVRAELANEDGKEGLALTVEWDRDPGRGFRWFSPYWLANSREGSTYIVDEIASIGLVNNPNIPEFRLANEAEVNANKETQMELDIEELLKLFGLPPEASAEDLMKAIRLAHDAQTAKDAADERARQAEADRRDAAEDAAKARKDLENEKKAHAATQAALANERGAMADMALDAAVREKRIGETARKTWKERLLKDGAACDSYRNPMFGYFKGAALAKMRDKAGLDCFAAANAMSADYCFPSRLEELEVLKIAVEATPGLAATRYYLGEILWNMDQKDAAIASWTTCVELCEKADAANCVPSAKGVHALALRCLGFGTAHPGTYFTNTGVPGGIASKEAYGFYKRAMEADPSNFRALEEMDKLAEKLEVPAADRLATMEKYRATAEKYDACMLRMAYLYNEVGKYDAALAILQGRRFHVWEGGEGLLAPFVAANLGRGRELMAEGRNKDALAYFERANTYPANLQAGRPGDAGTAPKVYYWIAQCKKAMGDAAGCKAALEESLKGWIFAGEMDYWRFKACKELGRDADAAEHIPAIKKAIADLEKPLPKVIDAYAKFGGENSPMERAANRAKKAASLKALLAEMEKAL